MASINYKDIDLTGEIKLDEKSIIKLKQALYYEVLDEMKKGQMSTAEIIELVKSALSVREYDELIRSSIERFIMGIDTYEAYDKHLNEGIKSRLRLVQAIYNNVSLD